MKITRADLEWAFSQLTEELDRSRKARRRLQEANAEFVEELREVRAESRNNHFKAIDLETAHKLAMDRVRASETRAGSLELALEIKQAAYNKLAEEFGSTQAAASLEQASREAEKITTP